MTADSTATYPVGSMHCADAPVYGFVSNITAWNETGGFVGVGTAVSWMAHADLSDVYVPITYFQSVPEFHLCFLLDPLPCIWQAALNQ